MDFLKGVLLGWGALFALIYGTMRLLQPTVRREVAALENAQQRFDEYAAANPITGEAATMTGSQSRSHQQQQTDLMHTLERELQDIKQRLAMLMFKLNMGQPGGTGRPAQAADYGPTYEAEPEIILPEPHHSAAHSDVASDLYDED
jgi:hypothetical protein